MGYYRLVKDGPTIDNILKCFNTWDFSTYPTIESYVNTFIGGSIWGNIRGTLTDQTDLITALNSKANDADVVHLTGAETIPGIKTFIDTIYIKESQGNFVTLKCLSSNKIQIGSGAGVSTTLRIGDASGGGSHRGQVEINADGEITCLEDDYGVTAYLQFPAKGTSSQRATLATTEDCGTKLYKHTFSHIASEGPTLDYIITATSTPYVFTGTQGPISQIGKDALKIVTSGAITLGLSQTDEFKGQIAVITGYTIASYNLIFNSGGTTKDTVSPL